MNPPTLFDVQEPPTAAEVMDALAAAAADHNAGVLAVLSAPNVRPDDVENARRAAAKVAAGRTQACVEVYAFIRGHWPEPVEASQVTLHFIATMRDPERRLRELRAAMIESGAEWMVTNASGRWLIERTGQ